MLKRGFLNPDVLREGLQAGKGVGRDFSLTPVSVWDAFPFEITCGLRIGLLAWLVRDAMSVSRMKKPEPEPSLELQLHCTSLKGNSSLHEVSRASNRPINTLAYICMYMYIQNSIRCWSPKSNDPAAVLSTSFLSTEKGHKVLYCSWSN